MALITVRKVWNFKWSEARGGVLSPILFNIYMDELIKQLEQSGDSCHIDHIFYGALGYADDLILLSPTANVLQRMLETFICETC